MNIDKEIMLLNKPYTFDNCNGIKSDDNINYKVILGNIPILLSAPHAVKQFRNGKEKNEDMNTGGIVEYLCKTCNCYGIIRNHNNYDDPNFDISGTGLLYKKQILEIVQLYNIKVVLDIHGCSNSHNFDFCLGTNNGKNLNGEYKVVDILKLELNKIGILAIDEIFKASLEGNISRYISSNSSIPAIQLEISNKFRNYPLYLEQLIILLQNVIKNICLLF